MPADKPPPPQALRSTCPRCGYDLRGVIATWADTCPLTGTCSECGLALEWSDVLRPDRQGPLWSIEFARGRFAWIHGTVQTLIRSLIPWHFWKRLRLEHPVNTRRLGVYILCMLMMVATTYWLGHAIWLARYWDVRFDSLNRPGGATVDTTAFRAWAKSAFMPWLDSPVGTATPPPTQPPGTWPLPTPYDLLRSRVTSPAFPAFSNKESPLVGFTLFFAYPATVVLGWYIGLLLIPRRMRTRSILAAHLFRLAAISAIFLVLAHIPPLLQQSVSALSRREIERGESSNYFALFLLAAVPAMTVWWAVACRSYLRLKNWIRMSLAVSLFGFIAIPTFLILALRAIM